jgi:8-oxo-dGTP pyrophosphatase MutT (NUDIX family)
MKQIIFTDRDFNEPIRHVRHWRTRDAARAVLFHEGKVALLHVSKRGYYKTPGGGIENGETCEQALHRELLEETGCTIKVRKELPTIVERRSRIPLIQTSHAFVADVIQKGTPQFTASEKREGMKLLWVPLEEAIALTAKPKPKRLSVRFMLKRELTILEQAR